MNGADASATPRVAPSPGQRPSVRDLVRIEAVSKSFGTTTAVDEVSLTIDEGEIFCLLGGSGCGKTTLLRMLAGFEQPTRGRIIIDGRDMNGVPAYERPVNMMFQSYALFPHMSVRRNVAFGLEQERLPRAQIAERVERMLETVRLTDLAERRPHQLSGGQRQRVALARALVKRPRLLLLDEPLAALDRKLREHTQLELRALQQQLGVTFVVVTHDQEEAMTLANRIGVMDRGRIVQVGTPTEIYEFPATRFVADFIGSVNLFEGRLVEDEPDHVRVHCEELQVPVYVDHGISAPPDARVAVAIRPEKIAMHRQASAAPDAPSAIGAGSERAGGVVHGAAAMRENREDGVVREVAYMGDLSLYFVEISSGRLVRVAMPNVERHAQGRIAAGDRVELSWQASSPVVLMS